MSSFEFNKIFAAVLVAGIVAMLAGFISKKAVHPEMLEKDVVTIEGSDVSHGGASNKPKLPDPITHLLAEASIEKGAKLTKACAACHSFEKGGPVKQGPNMWNTVNSDIGKKAGFEYSDTFANATGQWDYASLNQFLAKPKAYMPGTKMNFVGLKKPQDRADVIAFLRTLADSPAALPTEAQIAAEKALLAPEDEETHEEEAPADASPESAPESETATEESPQTSSENGEEENALTPHAGEKAPEQEKPATETPATETPEATPASPESDVQTDDKEAKTETPASIESPQKAVETVTEALTEPAAGITEQAHEKATETLSGKTAKDKMEKEMKTAPIQVFETFPENSQQH